MGMDVAGADWKQAIEKLLVTERGTLVDQTVYTKQKHASVFCKAYRRASSIEERRAILTYLIQQYGRSRVEKVSIPKETDEMFFKKMMTLLKDVPPPYQQLFRAIGQLEDGIKFLVDLRKDVLTWFREIRALVFKSFVEMKQLKLMNAVLRDLLITYFNIGLLHVERVTWKSPCDFMQKVAESEQVHPVRSWGDLKNRVGSYRRCFVFTHPAMPGEPLVVLHVALTDRIPEKITSVIRSRNDESHPEEDLSNINAAVFYSICSTQPGLKGVDLGYYLIKSVLQQLTAELPSISNYASLSPIPGFRKWLVTHLRNQAGGFPSTENFQLEPADLALLSDSLNGDDNDWYANENLRKQLGPILFKTCAVYLLRAKHRGYAADPVANFHFRNGAMMWRLNWEADTTEKGLNQSCSLMVNYRYYLAHTDKYRRSYFDEKKIHVSRKIIVLLKKK